MVQALIDAIRASKAMNHTLRFPKMTGKSNMVPVDQAAESIGKAIQGNRLETLYITNPEPPRSEWVLNEVINFYNVHDSVKVMDISFEKFDTLQDITKEEAALHRFFSHFRPYWSMQYIFPPSVCANNLINHDYLMRILNFFHGQRTY